MDPVISLFYEVCGGIIAFCLLVLVAFELSDFIKWLRSHKN